MSAPEGYETVRSLGRRIDRVKLTNAITALSKLCREMKKSRGTRGYPPHLAAARRVEMLELLARELNGHPGCLVDLRVLHTIPPALLAAFSVDAITQLGNLV